MIPFVLVYRSVRTTFIAAIIALIVGVVILSPFALSGIAHFRKNWLELSNIGQTYGAISAILSALALGGILASLLYQSRDSRNSYEQMMRTFQFELVKLEIGDPVLMSAMGAPWNTGIPADTDSVREFLYVQMWVSFWASTFATSGMSPAVARELAAQELFQGRAGRSYWAAAGLRQLTHSKGRYHQFFSLIDEEYKKTVSKGVPPAAPLRNAESPASKMTSDAAFSKLSRTGLAVVAAGAIGLIAGRLLESRKG